MRRNAVRALFICAIIFAPLAFGAVETWSIAVIELMSLAAIVLFLLKRRNDPVYYDTPGILPLMLFLGVILFQCVPLPSWFVRHISPASYDIRTMARIDAAQSAWMPLSINVKATLADFFRYASYVAIYFIGVQLLSRKDMLRKTVKILTYFTAALSLFALIQHFLPNGRIYWFRVPEVPGSIFGPYVNRNHYADLMAMLFPVTLGAFIYYIPRTNGDTLRSRLAAAMVNDRSGTFMYMGLACLLCFVSVLISLSRGGLIAIAVSIMLFIALTFKVRGGRRRSWYAVAVVCILVVVYAGWFGVEPILARFDPSNASAGDLTGFRRVIWSDSSSIINDFPLIGSGFGTFGDVYKRYQTLTGIGREVRHAHNDYIEMLAGGGIVSAILFCSFLLTAFYRAFTAFSRRREVYSLYICAGALAGASAFLVHGLFDFNLQIGANGLYFFLFMALAVSSAHTRFRHVSERTYLRRRSLPRKSICLPVTSVVLAVSFIFNAGTIAADFAYSSYAVPGDSADAVEKYKAATILDPLDAAYWYMLAGEDGLLGRNDAAIAEYSNALWLEPSNENILKGFGLYLSSLGRYEAAGKILGSAVASDRNDSEMKMLYAIWLITNGRTEDGISISREVFSRSPERSGEFITLMVLNAMDDSTILMSLPDTVMPHIVFGEYLYNTGQQEKAASVFKKARNLLSREGGGTAGEYIRIYNFFQRAGFKADATDVAGEAVSAFPSNKTIKNIERRLGAGTGKPAHAQQ